MDGQQDYKPKNMTVNEAMHMNRAERRKLASINKIERIPGVQVPIVSKQKLEEMFPEEKPKTFAEMFPGVDFSKDEHFFDELPKPDDHIVYKEVATPDDWKCERENCKDDYMHIHSTYQMGDSLIWNRFKDAKVIEGFMSITCRECNETFKLGGTKLDIQEVLKSHLENFHGEPTQGQTDIR